MRTKEAELRWNYMETCSFTFAPLNVPVSLLDFITTERTIDFVLKNRCITHQRAADTEQNDSEYSNVYKAVCNENENIVRRVDVV